mmetsp:Transcript_478/g.1790  ORF Transcript_478/g.1790 Transcript_478/m.1790 type:complete len:216 (+) Transcript_478:2069-2716(+)
MTHGPFPFRFLLSRFVLLFSFQFTLSHIQKCMKARRILPLTRRSLASSLKFAASICTFPLTFHLSQHLQAKSGVNLSGAKRSFISGSLAAVALSHALSVTQLRSYSTYFFSRMIFERMHSRFRDCILFSFCSCFIFFSLVYRGDLVESVITSMMNRFWGDDLELGQIIVQGHRIHWKIMSGVQYSEQLKNVDIVGLVRNQVKWIRDKSVASMDQT